MANDSILVLGANGFVGKHLVRALVAQGKNVIAASRHVATFRTEGVEWVVGPFDEPEHFVRLLERSTAVVHAASRSTPGSSAGNAIAELRINLQPTVALLQALQQTPEVTLLYLSSGGSLYPASTGDAPATEASAVRPRSYHGAGKVAAEQFISAWCDQNGRAATILRPSNIYGPGQSARSGFGIIPTGFSKIRHSETLTVWGDGSAVRDYLYIDDFTALCEAVLTRPMHTGMLVLNAASGRGVSLDELFGAMEKVAARPLHRFYDRARAVDAARVVIDASAAQACYDWTSTTTLHEGLKKTWDWFSTTPP